MLFGGGIWPKLLLELLSFQSPLKFGAAAAAAAKAKIAMRVRMFQAPGCHYISPG
jgi:hypothetical protein